MSDRLPADLLCVIGCRLDAAADRIRFRAVSKSWRSAFPCRQQPTLMMLSKSQNLIELVAAGEESVCKTDILTILGTSSIVGSSGNWLIIKVNLSSGSIRLLNPFSEIQFHPILPSLFRFHTGDMFKDSDALVQKVVLSSAPPCDGGDTDFIAVATLRRPNQLAIFRPGDAYWTTVADYPNKLDTLFDDVIFYKGQFYAISTRGKLAVCDILDDASEPPRLSFVSDCSTEKISSGGKYYLVEWLGELLMIVRFLKTVSAFYDYRDFSGTTKKFKVYKFDFVSMKFEELKCLGDHSLFLGLNTSVSVAASSYFGTVRRNCIYFTDDRIKYNAAREELQIRNYDIGVFDLEDNSIAPHYNKNNSTDQSVWIIPTE